ncbi:type II toxin-antitoxin system prevent-host-death family antitoxin [Nakamurella sp. YIM 132087]|uniref:Type II toxin-antitoxin system prevent-host-death family antitoxin n=1 Tax=Nakamurella alba TaxID=2665158 RepID=A0A7K1FPF6_9ACTN|nr:type II toxin-antitoxin system prevent-host-death family antitoxin [Nakamurella alba]MTD16027.1 type II toxin-antitoxin system prevent-host-death family antitoxin [Nakamurella alba]
MATVSHKKLGDQVAVVLGRVEAGEHLTVTVAGREVAELVPVPRHRWVSGPDLVRTWKGPTSRSLAKDGTNLPTTVVDPDELR